MFKGDDTSYKSATYSAIKLASLLQRALDRGRANHAEMSEVSKYIMNVIHMNIVENMKYLEYIAAHNNDKNVKRLKHDLMTLFNDLILYEMGYEKLLTSNGSIEREKLELLINVDTEIINSITLIRNMLICAKRSDGISKEDEDEIRKIASELEHNVAKRKEIL